MLATKLTSSRSVPRSLLYFVIRDHIGNTPLSNLRNTLLQDLGRIWSSLSKPPGLEDSKIQDYFDFAFVALPHKILQPEKFVSEVQKLGTRFREGYKDSRGNALQLDEDDRVSFCRSTIDAFLLMDSRIMPLVSGTRLSAIRI